jgi:hypothetical protein
MNETSNVVRGVLNPDGTLELDERPSLPAGRVEVTIRPFRTKEENDAGTEDIPDRVGQVDEAPRPLEGYGPYLRRVRARREAEGFPFRSREEIDAEMDDLRSWDDRAEEIPRSADDEPGSDDRRC